MEDKEFMASLNDTESDFEFVEKVKDELEKRGLGSECKSFVEEIGKEQNPENFGAIAEKYLSKGKEEPKVEKPEVKDIDTNDNGEIEVDELADFQKSLDDYASKNKKGRDDIPVTTRR